MQRKWASARCPDCKKVPHRDPAGSGTLVCDCGTRTWFPRKGVKGSEAEVDLLKKHGFDPAEDIQGDIYYAASGHLVHLFPDGTWHSDKAAEGSNLEEYLKWVHDGATGILI